MKQWWTIKSFLLIPSENNSPRLHHEDRFSIKFTSGSLKRIFSIFLAV